MAKYKAKDTYKDLDNKYFQYGTQKTLMRGGNIELDENSFNKLPKEVKEELELLNKPKKKKVLKTDTKKNKKKENK